MTAEAHTGLRVDIVVNNFDYGEYVTRAVDSALAQSHPAVNVIVVDDGSTDGSRQRLESYGDRIDLVLKENGGQASALNAGARRCRGDVVMFLDADDVLEPHAAAWAAALFAADPEVVKVQFRMAVIDAQDRPTGVLKPPAHLPLPTGDVRQAELSFPFDLAWLPTSGNAFRRAALETILPIPEAQYPRCADWYLNHLTALLGRVASVADVGARYRIHGRNNYEPQTHTLDLDHVRETIGYAQSTARALAELADRLGYERRDPILSLSDLAFRLVSLRLEPARHPRPDDRVRRLFLDAIRATRRREDVSWLMKALFVAWFLLAAAGPRPLVRTLGEMFLFHERRPRLTLVIRRMHRPAHGAGRRGRSASRAP